MGAGWPSGGEQPRITFSPRLAEVDTGTRENSCWMSGIVKCEAKVRSSYSQISDIPQRKFDDIIVSDVFLCVSSVQSQ